MKTCGPDFFIVGAPKCGTTALDTYLADHPSIFMAEKEKHFFGSDLDEIWTQRGNDRRPTAEEYFALFAESGAATRRGESSVWYLWSRRAADEIHSYNQRAQIIVMLRNPVDMLPSLHSQYLHDDIEDIQDFGQAFAAEDDRRRGLRIPARNNGPCPWMLFYREIVRFHEQLERYVSIFGLDHIHVILFDEFAADPGAHYREVLKFLDVDSTFVPSFQVVNPNRKVRSRWLQHRVWDLLDPSSAIRRIGSRLIPVHPMRSVLLSRAVPALMRLNTSFPQRPPLDRTLRAHLAAELAPDIRRLGEVLGRDLSHWYEAETEMRRSPPLASASDAFRAA